MEVQSPLPATGPSFMVRPKNGIKPFAGDSDSVSSGALQTSISLERAILSHAAPPI